jgi:hypothetical protein
MSTLGIRVIETGVLQIDIGRPFFQKLLRIFIALGLKNYTRLGDSMASVLRISVCAYSIELPLSDVSTYFSKVSGPTSVGLRIVVEFVCSADINLSLIMVVLFIGVSETSSSSTFSFFSRDFSLSSLMPLILTYLGYSAVLVGDFLRIGLILLPMGDELSSISVNSVSLLIFILFFVGGSSISNGFWLMHGVVLSESWFSILILGGSNIC